MLFKGFFSIFNFSGHFVQLRGTALAILVEGYPRDISDHFFFKIGPLA